MIPDEGPTAEDGEDQEEAKAAALSGSSLMVTAEVYTLCVLPVAITALLGGS